MLGLFLTSSLDANAQCDKESKKKAECKTECSKDEKKAMAEGEDCDLQKTAFAVQGNCSMCEARIEKAAKSVEGVKKASWNKENDMITIYHEKGGVEVKDVHKAIAEAGHDTEEMKASSKNFASLPTCCQYRDN